MKNVRELETYGAILIGCGIMAYTRKNIKAHEGNGYVFDYRVHIKSFPKTTKFAYIK